METVSPEYKATLEGLAISLVTPERFGKPLVAAAVEAPDNIIRGEE